jgi:NADH-quinone oxidoreductase subunit H
MEPLSTIGWIALRGLIAFGVGLGNVVVFLYVERKLLADMQVRMGPMRVGPHGILQPIADVLKLLTKEDIKPAARDRFMYFMAPIISLAPAVMLYLAIPLSPTFYAANLDLGIFYLFGVMTVVPVGILVAGWASYNKYSLIGGLRAAAQQISYEIPLLASILGVIMMAGSFNLIDIVNAQAGFIKIGGLSVLPRWFLFYQPFAFLFFLTAALADCGRTPFDIPEAESELVQGYQTEYSSIRFALFFVGEYSDTLIVAALCTLVFFGGWSGPFLPNIVWFFLKVYAFVFLITWIRATLPRFRIDQLMNFGWKILLPLTLLNVMVTGFLLVR